MTSPVSHTPLASPATLADHRLPRGRGLSGARSVDEYVSHLPPLPAARGSRSPRRRGCRAAVLLRLGSALRDVDHVRPAALAQPWLLERVGVAWPHNLERALFGWMTGGVAPPRAARAWLALHSASPIWAGAAWSLEVVYLSHVFAYPALLLGLWLREGPRRSGAIGSSGTREPS